MKERTDALDNREGILKEREVAMQERELKLKQMEDQLSKTWEDQEKNQGATSNNEVRINVTIMFILYHFPFFCYHILRSEDKN